MGSVGQLPAARLGCRQPFVPSTPLPARTAAAAAATWAMLLARKWQHRYRRKPPGAAIRRCAVTSSTTPLTVGIDCPVFVLSRLRCCACPFHQCFPPSALILPSAVARPLVTRPASSPAALICPAIASNLSPVLPISSWMSTKGKFVQLIDHKVDASVDERLQPRREKLYPPCCQRNQRG